MSKGLYFDQAFRLVTSIDYVCRSAVKPFFNLFPDEDQLPGCWLDVMNIFYELFLPNQVSNSSGRHFYALAELIRS